MREKVADIGYALGKAVIGIGNRILWYTSTRYDREMTDCGITDEEAWIPREMRMRRVEMWPGSLRELQSKDIRDVIYAIDPDETPPPRFTENA